MMDTASNNLLKEIITDEDGKELLEVTVDSGKLTPPKAMDSNDLKLVNAFISNINMQEFYKEKICCCRFEYSRQGSCRLPCW